jgi:predicted  nucleic acid-binding Zn-ribbon protein
MVLAVVLGYSLGVSDSARELGSLERELDLVKARELRLHSELDSAQVRVQDSESELVQVKKKAQVRESELEMALDSALAKVMVQG